MKAVKGNAPGKKQVISNSLRIIFISILFSTLIYIMDTNKSE